MIYSVHVIIRSSGMPIFSRTYVENSLDSVLVSGFLSALANLSFEEIPGEGGIESIRMKSNRWVYLTTNDLYFVFCADRSHPISSMKHQIRYLEKMFRKDYSKEVIEKWKGNVGIFRRFTKKVDRLMKEWDEALDTAEDTKAMDIIGIYENILNRLLMTDIKPAKRKKLIKLIEDYTLNNFTPEAVKFANGDVDLFGIMNYSIDYDTLKIRLNSLFENVYEYLLKNSSKSAILHTVEKRLFPFIRYYYSVIDVYNIDRYVFPKLLSIFQNKKKLKSKA